MNEGREQKLALIKERQNARNPNLTLQDAKEKMAYGALLYDSACNEIERLNTVIKMLNPSNKAYVIKFANGEAQLMTAEHAQTHDGIAALAFAKEAGEEVLFLDTDDAVDLIMDICHNKKTAALN